MEDFEEIDLHMVPFGEVFRYAAQGWVVASTMAECIHGGVYGSVLMEREVAQGDDYAGNGDAGDTAANDSAGALVGRPFRIGKRRAAPD